MSSPEVPRIHATDLIVEGFLSDYVTRNRPVVVSGSLNSWGLYDKWTPSSLESMFGDRMVPIYNNYFDLQTIMPLKQYFAENFKKDRKPIAVLPYVRWYTKQVDRDFYWADDIFRQLEKYWSPPRFLPDGGYVLPYSPAGAGISPVTNYFPAKGLFISPRGARTSLHRDPWETCAVLCQLYGKKRWYFYGPEQAEYLQNEYGTVDVTQPDHRKFPLFSMAPLAMTCTLEPGEVVYIPHGWFHQVECESDSISLTWNFVHLTTVTSYIEWLVQAQLSTFDESVLRFFYGIAPGSKVVEAILTRIRAMAGALRAFGAASE